MQKQTLKCSDVRHLIHLAVGDDTFPEEELRLTEHLHECADCRAYHAETVSALHVLEQVRDVDAEDSAPSLWPGLSKQLQVRPAAPPIPEKRRFNISVVALCASSLTLALVTLIGSLPTNHADSFGSVSAMPAMNVNLVHRPRSSAESRPMRTLIEVPAQGGGVVWVDPVTRQAYIPDVIRPTSQPTAEVRDRNLNF
ncbi:MAG: zf-HC2 domain-containing protein [Planctomycetaceae bacterium]|nr:zf-HC2 domain-containing protein [Planctomycetaceae bacterium]